MKDNIESKNIGNRKIIIELRFDHKVMLSDKKGAIIERIKSLGLFAPFHWEIGMANLLVYDNSSKEDARNFISVELNKISFVSNKIDSIESYYSKFEKIYEAILDELGDLIIRRIGCRIQGSYYVKSNSFDVVLKNFSSNFPTTFFLDNYQKTDMLFRLNYENGMYNICPIKDKNDPFLERNFEESIRVNHVGIAIDTDNYLTDEKEVIKDKQAIKDVFVLSLSVEKDLFSNLKDL